jgi:predicted RNA-binding protein with PUA-like domain
MAYWLLKEEPEEYNFADLEKDKVTLWDGVSNNLARQNLRKIRPGDRLLYYHTGKEKAVVGEAVAASGPLPEPGSADPKAVVIRVKAVRRLPHPVSLARIKADPTLSGWDLVRLARLSVVPVSEVQWQRVEELSRQK